MTVWVVTWMDNNYESVIIGVMSTKELAEAKAISDLTEAGNVNYSIEEWTIDG